MLVFHCRIQLTSMSYIKSPAPTIRRRCDVCFIRRYRMTLVNCSIVNVHHRFNTTAKTNNKFQMAIVQGSHWLIESPTVLPFTYSPPLSHICQSFNNLFHSFITHCENEYFLISNLHCFSINAAVRCQTTSQ